MAEQTSKTSQRVVVIDLNAIREAKHRKTAREQWLRAVQHEAPLSNEKPADLLEFPPQSTQR